MGYQAIVASLVPLLLLLGCVDPAGDDDDATGQPGDDDAADDDAGDDDLGDDDTSSGDVDPGLVLVEDHVDCDALTIEEDRVIVPLAGHEALLQLDSQNLLVSACDHGLLRRVVSHAVQGDDLVIETLQASLTDAVIHGSVSETLDLVDGGREDRFAGVAIDIGGTELYSDGVVTVRFSEGSIAFDPEIDLDIDIVDREVQRFTVEANGTLTSALALEVVADGAVQHAPPPITLWETSRTYVTLMGWVPVVTVVYLKLDAGFSVGVESALSVSAGAQGSLTVGGGFDYEDGVLTPIANFENHGVEPIGPSITVEGGLGATAWIEPRIEIEFYDVGGPTLASRASAMAHVPFADPLCGWSLEGALDVTVSAELDVLDYQLQLEVPPLYHWQESILDPTAWPEWETHCCDRDFSITVPGDPGPGSCTTVRGDVSISGPLLTDVSAMQSVQTVEGDLRIQDATILNDLSGLSSLQEIQGGLWLERNPMITDLSMTSLGTVGGNVTITENDAMQALTGLGALQSVGGTLYLIDMPQLADTSDLSSLHSVGGLYLAVLPDLQVLELAVGWCPGDLDISELPALEQVLAPSLQTVDGNVLFEDLSSLVAIDLPALQTVGGNLTVLETPAVAAVTLPTLQGVTGSVEIGTVDAGVMSQVSIPLMTNVGGIVYVHDSGGATSPLQVLDLGSLVSAGNLDLEGLTNLSSLDLGDLQTVSDSLYVADLDQLPTLALPQLQSVGMWVTVSGGDLGQIQLPALHTTGKLLMITGTQCSSLQTPPLTPPTGDVFLSNNTNLVICNIWPWIESMQNQGIPVMYVGNDMTGYPACT